MMPLALAEAVSPPPQDCGRRLIPKLIDEIAVSDPERVFAAIPVSNDIKDGWRDITYRQFAVAASRYARWIEERLGKGNGEEVVFYMGPLDLRFPLVLVGALKAGYIAQFSSTRNSLEAHVSLLQTAKCKTILLPDDAPSVIVDIQARLKLNTIKAPSLERLLAESEDDHDNEIYPWNPDFEEARMSTSVVLHTSGSTGIPKPVFVPHGTFASNDMHQAIPSLGGRPVVLVELIKRKRVLVAFPLFHAACLGMVLGYSVFVGAIPVLPPPGPMTLEVVDYAHKHSNVEGSLIPPSLVVDIYKSPSAFNTLKENIKWLAYVGGTLANDVGDSISRHVKLITLMGSTETMYLPVESVDEPENWQQIPISPFLGHEYRPAHDGLNELVIKRNAELDLFQGAFCTFPAKEEYGMQDLYVQHSSIPRYWSFSARGDDLICFSNAEKLNPITIEAIVTSHPRVKGALIGGQGQFQASLLIEAHEPQPLTAAEKKSFIDEIWPTVMKANRETVAHGRVMKDFIFFTSPDRPFPRAGKTTIQRYAAMQSYKADFAALYESRIAPVSTDDRNPSAASAEKVTTDTTVTSKGASQKAAGAVKAKSSSSKGQSSTKLLYYKLEGLTERCDEVIFRLETLLDTAASRVNQPLNSGDRNDAVVRVVNMQASPSSSSMSRSLSSSSRASSGDLVDDAFSGSYFGSSCGRASENEWHATPTGIDDAAELRKALSKVLEDNAILHGLTEEADLFNCGLDSLQVPVVVAAINESLKATLRGKVLANKHIFSNPTVQQLAAMIMEP